MVLWLRALEHSTVTHLDNILGVVSKADRDNGVSAKPQQNGGMRCHFNGAAGTLGIRVSTPTQQPIKKRLKRRSFRGTGSLAEATTCLQTQKTLQLRSLPSILTTFWASIVLQQWSHGCSPAVRCSFLVRRLRTVNPTRILKHWRR